MHMVVRDRRPVDFGAKQGDVDRIPFQLFGLKIPAYVIFSLLSP